MPTANKTRKHTEKNKNIQRYVPYLSMLKEEQCKKRKHNVYNVAIQNHK